MDHPDFLEKVSMELCTGKGWGCTNMELFGFLIASLYLRERQYSCGKESRDRAGHDEAPLTTQEVPSQLSSPQSRGALGEHIIPNLSPEP